MKYRIGVMGSAQGPQIKVQSNVKKAIMLGQEIARADCILVNGACPGLPDEAAYGAKNVGGLTLGVSPAFSEQEHTKTYKSPSDNYDIILYTGLGLMERDILNIRSCDAVIILGGGVGTLNEYTVAYDEEKVIGVLTGTGGVSDHIDKIMKICDRPLADFVLFDDDPKALVHKVIQKLMNSPRPVSEDERIFRSGRGE